jgi:hypothetical protein
VAIEGVWVVNSWEHYVRVLGEVARVGVRGSHELDPPEHGGIPGTLVAHGRRARRKAKVVVIATESVWIDTRLYVDRYFTRQAGAGEAQFHLTNARSRRERSQPGLAAESALTLTPMSERLSADRRRTAWHSYSD